MVSGGVHGIGRVGIVLIALLLAGCPRGKKPPQADAPVGAALLADLVAAGVSGLPPEPIVVVAGGELVLGAAVSNAGAPFAPDAPVPVQLVLSSSRIVEPDAVVLADRVLSVPISTGARVKLPREPVAIDAPPGDWFLLQVVDPEQTVEEVYRSNNITVVAELRVELADSDGDGLGDDEELALARAFAPELVLHPEEECGTRHPAWAVRPIFGGASIFYALNWERDCGLPAGAGTAAHLGDAEFVVVDLLYDKELGWEITRIFLSAHFRAGDGRTKAGALLLDHSGWMPPEAFEREERDPVVAGGWHPKVVVARHKHANYPSVDACRLSYDSCAEGLAEPLTVRAGANLGSRDQPLLAEIERDGATEWFWRGPLPFCGWQVASVVLADRSGCAGLRNSWFEQLTAWQEERLE